MRIPEHYPADLLRFFDGRPDSLALYEALFQRLDAAFPEASVKVQKSQVSFYGRRLFAMASLPRRKKDPGLVVSFGLGRREPSPRITVAVEPYPGRWTHHVPVPEERELDGELLGWLWEAWEFNKTK
ncbi:MAG: hypothetical protein K1W21_08270 [Oscillospiraceae bacterium]